MDIAGAAQIDGLYFQQLMQCNLEFQMDMAHGNMLKDEDLLL